MLIETFAACAVLSACGSDDEPAPAASRPTPTVTATASPSATPTATPTATVTATPSATVTATATPGGDGGAEAPSGDEEGIGVPLAIGVATTGIMVEPATVPAFLPLEVTVISELDRAVDLVVLQAAGDGVPVGRVSVPAGGEAQLRIGGLQPGRAEVLAPDLGPEATARFVVERSN